LGINTLGAAIAPLVFGIVLVPQLGAHFALLLVAAGYLVLSSPRGWLAPTQWIAAAAVAALAVWSPSLAIVDVPDGGRIVSYREGAMATVSVVEDAGGVTTLRINNRQQEGSNATRYADARQALLPLLLHPSPRRALFLGLGTGVTVYSATDYAALQIDAVELLPEVIEASAYFTGIFTEATGSRRPRLIAADARRFVRASEEHYDVIIADNFHPARSGSGSLYTTQHFAAVRERLAPGGLFCQWLPLHQLDLTTLRSIVRSFLAVHPQGVAILATNSLDTPVIGLVARTGDGRFDADALRRAGSDMATPPQRLGSLGLADEFAVLGSLVAGPGALARFAGNAPLNTDDHPVVAYLAPHVTYAPDSTPRDRLIALLRELAVGVDLIAVDSIDPAWTQRLNAYRNARNRFIEIGRDVRPTTDVRAMVAQVREPLLSVLRISPDFRPAYDPLVRMARALGAVDAPAARSLLLELQQVHPVDP
jgi:spermidine synthase